MKIRCLVLGCHWDAGVERPLGPELLLQKVCLRCGARRTVSV
ncbi:hypothetical protein M2318_004864 [Metapseudomonas resinovorans]